MRRVARAITLLGALTWAGCLRASTPEALPPSFPRVPIEQVERLIPERVAERRGWAEDVLAALGEQQLPATPAAVCSVLAVIEQESAFDANPVVPGLPRIARTGLKEAASRLGPLGQSAVDELLSQ